MNGTEQRERSTRLHEIEVRINKLAEAWDQEFKESNEKMTADLRGEFKAGISNAMDDMASETIKLMVAERQARRDYVMTWVDRFDNHLANVRLDDFTANTLTFWGRLLWLFRGTTGVNL